MLAEGIEGQLFPQREFYENMETNAMWAMEINFCLKFLYDEKFLLAEIVLLMISWKH